MAFFIVPACGYPMWAELAHVLGPKYAGELRFLEVCYGGGGMTGEWLAKIAQNLPAELAEQVFAILSDNTAVIAQANDHFARLSDKQD